MSDERLDGAVQLIDEAREHANRGLTGIVDGWGLEARRQAEDTLERAIAYLSEAESFLIETDPTEIWTGFDGEPIPPYLSRAISSTYSARQAVSATREAGDVRTSRLMAEANQLLDKAGAALDAAGDHLMGVASGAFSFSELVEEALALGTNVNEEFMRRDGWHAWVRDADGRLVAFLPGCDERDRAWRFAFDERRARPDCRAWITRVDMGMAEPPEEVLSDLA